MNDQVRAAAEKIFAAAATRAAVVVDLYVFELGPAQARRLGLGRERRPAGHVVDVLLHDDVAAAREVRVVVGGDQRRVGQLGAGRVRGAVDEAEQVAPASAVPPARVEEQTCRAPLVEAEPVRPR